MQFLRHNWRNKADIADLRQEVYVRVYEAARKQIPDPAKPFVFTTARNLLIDRVRREHDRSHRGGGRSGCARTSPPTSRGPTAASSRAMNCAVCRPHSTACRRAAAKPSCCADRRACRAARSRAAWASAKHRRRASRRRHARARRYALRRSRRTRRQSHERQRQTSRCRRTRIELRRAGRRMAGAARSRQLERRRIRRELDAWLAQSPAHMRRLLCG